MILRPGDAVTYIENGVRWRGILVSRPDRATPAAAWGWWLTKEIGLQAGMAEWIHAPTYARIEPDPDGDALLARFTAWRLTQ